jgi:hypothetical protein
MRKIIHGKLYDTETAEGIHDFPGFPKPLWAARLYETKNGSFFLYYYGMTVGFHQSIEPLTEEEAFSWLETRGGDEVLLSRFPDKVTEA